MKLFRIIFHDGRSTRQVEWYAQDAEHARRTFERDPNWAGEIKRVEFLEEVL